MMIQIPVAIRHGLLFTNFQEQPLKTEIPFLLNYVLSRFQVLLSLKILIKIKTRKCAGSALW